MEAYEIAANDCEISLKIVQFGMEAYEIAVKDCEISLNPLFPLSQDLSLPSTLSSLFSLKHP